MKHGGGFTPLMLMDDLKIEYLNIKSLRPYEKNARKHQREDLDTIKASIEEFGMSDPIGIWSDKNIIVEGHGRWTVCKELGMERVPCIRLDHLTDEQRRAYALAHNKTAEMSSWLDDIVSGEISNIFKIDMKKFGFKVYNPFEGLEKPEDPEPEYPEEDNSYYGDERERSFNSMNLHEVDRSRLAGKYQMPIIEACHHVPTDLISFNYMLTSSDFDKGIHFYIDDYQFERLWNDPQQYMEKLARFDCVLTPDFSILPEMPLAMQIWNIYRSRMVGQICQSYGMNVIPTLSWCMPESYEFCFDGIEHGGVVSVSTVGVKQNQMARNIWTAGMDEALRKLQPNHIIVYGGDIGYSFKGCDVTYIGNHNTERFKSAKNAEETGIDY